jgi:ribonuclease-3
VTDAEYQKFARETLGVEFRDITLLVTAFTHRSWVNEHRRQRGIEQNERLEFLGDAVLELISTEWLYKEYPGEAEGVLTNWRSALVRTESIGAAAEKLGYWSYMRLSRGEKQATKRAQLQILANAFEAVLGALYLDQGYDPARQLVEREILTTLKTILQTGSWQDGKSRLQELAQEQISQTPIYKVLDEHGPDHDKIFTIGVYLGDKLCGKGQGPSKQLAQQAAAEEALLNADAWQPAKKKKVA